MVYEDEIFSGDALYGQQFTDCRFFRCSFPEARLKFSVFRKCRFESCDFSSVSCDGTGFFGCAFPESKLSDLNLFQVGFSDCDFSGAVLRNCIFQRLQGPRSPSPKKFDLRTCAFRETDLTGSVFISCDLSGTAFTRSNLERASFDRCILKKTDFTGAVLDGARFVDCRIEKAVLDLSGFISYGRSNGFELEG